MHPEKLAFLKAINANPREKTTQLAFADESNILDKHDPIDDYINRILPNKLQLDALYAQRSHIRLDTSVLFWTIAAVIMHRPVAVNRATGRMTTRRRPASPPDTVSTVFVLP